MNDYDVMQIHHAGLIIVESYAMVDHHVEQFRFPRSKKRRIRKKFAKKYTHTVTTPSPNFIVTTTHAYCHPIIAEDLRRIIKREEERQLIKWR